MLPSTTAQIIYLSAQKYGKLHGDDSTPHTRQSDNCYFAQPGKPYASATFGDNPFCPCHNRAKASRQGVLMMYRASINLQYEIIMSQFSIHSRKCQQKYDISCSFVRKISYPMPPEVRLPSRSTRNVMGTKTNLPATDINFPKRLREPRSTFEAIKSRLQNQKKKIAAISAPMGQM